MTTGMYGLDPHDCRELVKLLKNSAQQLERTSVQLSQTVVRTRWQGPDSQRFRQQWPGNRMRLTQTARDLTDMAEVVLGNIADQERASAVDNERLWDNLIDAGTGLWNDVTDGGGQVADVLRDGLAWGRESLTDLLTSQPAMNFLGQATHLGQLALGPLTGNPPSVAALVAQLVLTAGTGVNLAVTLGTGGRVDFQLFDDGAPQVGGPRTVTNGSANPLQRPHSVSSIFASVEDAYAMGHVPGTENGDVRIVKVEQADGTYAYIVNIPGTEQWGPTGSGQARDLTSNLMLVTGQSTTAQRSIVLAMERAGIPAGAPVMLAGHSQGGMLAVHLGSDQDFLARYNVTNIMTVGSPIDITAVDPGINVLAAQHEGDVVPKLDLGGLNTHLQMPGTPSNVTVVTMDDPPRDVLGTVLHNAPSPLGNLIQGGRDAMNNHATENYRSDLANTAKYPGLASYEQEPSLGVFLSNDPGRVSAVDIPVGRG